MKRLIKLLFSLVLVTILSFTVIVKASVEDFSSLDVVKTSSVMTDQELDAGVKLYQVGTTAYNDGIILKSILCHYQKITIDSNRRSRRF